MRILITGGTGFVGKALIARWQQNHYISVITRHPELHQSTPGHSISYISLEDLRNDLKGFDVVINLAGEPILDWPWTTQQLQKIRSSRIDFTLKLISYLQLHPNKPSIFISASAVGFYGYHQETVFDETMDPGKDPAATLCSDWEKSALTAPASIITLLRFGVIMGRKGGFLRKLIPLYKLGLGGPIGTGQQWISWVHIDDVVEIIESLIANPHAGPINVTTTEPVRQIEFSKKLAELCHRWNIFPIPKWALETFFGEGGKLLTEGQKAFPEVLKKREYQYKYSNMREALTNSV